MKKAIEEKEQITEGTEVMSHSPTDLIKVTQLPIIVEQLTAIRDKIQTATNKALTMDCNEDTYKDIKKIKAQLNNDFEVLEDLRKSVKRQILAPYEEFNAIYQANVTDVFKPAERQLNAKIKLVEDVIVERTRASAEEYFIELANYHNLSFLRYEDMELHITMSSTKKKVFSLIDQYINRIAEDITNISALEDKDEVLFEYVNTTNYDLGRSLHIVNNRKKKIAEQKLSNAEREERIQKQAEAVERVRAAVEEAKATVITEPVVEELPKLYKTTFTVTATIQQLRDLKVYLDERNIKYE